MIVASLPKIVAFEQKSVFDCGVAMVRAIYASLVGVVLDEKSLRDKLGSKMEHGTRVEDIKKFFADKGLAMTETENTSIEDIKRGLGEGKLCLVVYQAWGTEKEYSELESGHYSVIYGVDEEDVYLLDPSIHKDDGLGLGRRKLSLERFLANWKDKDDADRLYTRWCLAVGTK
jgi:ABC-type bacteriocin/lantibiotic exporter with double-glycine peptidase domain